MTYVCSDIHGCYDCYINFLGTLNSCDKVYVIGDVLDRSSDGIKILMDIMNRKNVVMIKGNHELMLLPVLEELSYSNRESQQEIIEEEINIADIGQEDTLRAFCKLGRSEQNNIISFIDALPLYMKLSVNNRKYLLVHAGLPDFDNLLDMDYYTEDELLFGPHDFSIRHFDDTKIIVGHLPTRFIDGAEPDEIFEGLDSIDIDCGCGFGGKLGVLCLESGEKEYY